ncbi:MAG: tetraacyldisaccharide 4'-kinase [Candidatus Omnitrophota bacterium]|nr:tetraacyldisaccharide 4'-kinase [Candidatus Omnitrophota bacterium]
MSLKIIFLLLSAPFAFLYFIIIFVRNVFYDFNIFRKHKISAKVVSVGNITWGGTGKTPVVAFIAELVTRKSRRASILIRGYGNDESELLPKLTSNVPVLTGKDRVKTGVEAIENHLSDTVILDDGFQYRRLKRDLDIVCLDAVKPFGNGWVIPAGILREGLGSLKRADVFLITKSDLVSDKDKLERLEKKLKSINPGAIIAKAIHRPLYFYKILDGEKVNIGMLQNRELALVSAIGSPGCFEKTILRLGLKVNKHFVFRDHHLYVKDDMDKVNDYCSKNNIDTVISTEKDAVKLKNLKFTAYSLQLLVLKVRLEIIENEEGFHSRLFGIYNS